MDVEATLKTLRQALEVSPDNVPLREHLASTLLAAGRADEAAAEYREALARGAGSGAQVGLARAFFALGNATVATNVFVTLSIPNRPPASTGFPPGRVVPASIC